MEEKDAANNYSTRSCLPPFSSLASTSKVMNGAVHSLTQCSAAPRASLGPPSHQMQSGPPPNQIHSGPPSHQMQSGPSPHQMQLGPQSHLMHSGPPHQLQSGPPLHQVQLGPSPHQMQSGPQSHQMQSGPQSHQMQSGPQSHQMQSGPPPHQVHLGSPPHYVHSGSPHFNQHEQMGRPQQAPNDSQWFSPPIHYEDKFPAHPYSNSFMQSPFPHGPSPYTVNQPTYLGHTAFPSATDQPPQIPLNQIESYLSAAEQKPTQDFDAQNQDNGFMYPWEKSIYRSDNQYPNKQLSSNYPKNSENLLNSPNSLTKEVTANGFTSNTKAALPGFSSFAVSNSVYNSHVSYLPGLMTNQPSQVSGSSNASHNYVAHATKTNAAAKKQRTEKKDSPAKTKAKKSCKKLKKTPAVEAETVANGRGSPGPCLSPTFLASLSSKKVSAMWSAPSVCVDLGQPDHQSSSHSTPHHLTSGQHNNSQVPLLTVEPTRSQAPHSSSSARKNKKHKLPVISDNAMLKVDVKEEERSPSPCQFSPDFLASLSSKRGEIKTQHSSSDSQALGTSASRPYMKSTSLEVSTSHHISDSRDPISPGFLASLSAKKPEPIVRTISLPNPSTPQDVLYPYKFNALCSQSSDIQVNSPNWYPVSSVYNAGANFQYPTPPMEDEDNKEQSPGLSPSVLSLSCPSSSTPGLEEFSMPTPPSSAGPTQTSPADRSKEDQTSRILEIIAREKVKFQHQHVMPEVKRKKKKKKGKEGGASSEIKPFSEEQLEQTFHDHPFNMSNFKQNDSNNFQEYFERSAVCNQQTPDKPYQMQNGGVDNARQHQMSYMPGKSNFVHAKTTEELEGLHSDHQQFGSQKPDPRTSMQYSSIGHSVSNPASPLVGKSDPYAFDDSDQKTDEIVLKRSKAKQVHLHHKPATADINDSDPTASLKSSLNAEDIKYTQTSAQNIKTEVVSSKFSQCQQASSSEQTNRLAHPIPLEHTYTLQTNSNAQHDFRLSDKMVKQELENNQLPGSFSPSHHSLYNNSAQFVKIEPSYSDCGKKKRGRPKCGSTETKPKAQKYKLSEKKCVAPAPKLEYTVNGAQVKPEDIKLDQSLVDRLANNLMEVADCTCLSPDHIPSEAIEGPYYTQLGAARDIPAVRKIMEQRTGASGSAIRIEKVIFTGKEGKSKEGCPVAKWIIRRSGPDEKYLCIVRKRPGHFCDTSVIIVVIVAWEGVIAEQADSLYDFLITTLPKSGLETDRRCGLNEKKTCACQGVDLLRRGASFSFGCSWSMYYNGCKFARSQIARKFKLKDMTHETDLTEKLEQLANDVSPLYSRLAPDAFRNQTQFERQAEDCRLGTRPGRPFSGVTAVVDFCCHSHRDCHNMNNGSTVVVNLTKHRGFEKPDDEQYHVLPLYILDQTDEFGSMEGQLAKVRQGSLEVLSRYMTEVRMRSTPYRPCKRNRTTPKKQGAKKSPKKLKLLKSMSFPPTDYDSLPSPSNEVDTNDVSQSPSGESSFDLSSPSSKDRNQESMTYIELMAQQGTPGFNNLYKQFWDYFYTHGTFPPRKLAFEGETSPAPTQTPANGLVAKTSRTVFQPSSTDQMFLHLQQQQNVFSENSHQLRQQQNIFFNSEKQQHSRQQHPVYNAQELQQQGNNVFSDNFSKQHPQRQQATAASSPQSSLTSPSSEATTSARGPPPKDLLPSLNESCFTPSPSSHHHHPPSPAISSPPVYRSTPTTLNQPQWDQKEKPSQCETTTTPHPTYSHPHPTHCETATHTHTSLQQTVSSPTPLKPPPSYSESLQTKETNPPPYKDSLSQDLAQFSTAQPTSNATVPLTRSEFSSLDRSSYLPQNATLDQGFSRPLYETHRSQFCPTYTHRLQSQLSDPGYTDRLQTQGSDLNYTNRLQSQLSDPGNTDRIQTSDNTYINRLQSQFSDTGYTFRPQSNDPNITHRTQSNDPNFMHRPQSNDPNFTHRPQSNDPNITHRPQSNDPNIIHRPQSNDPNFTHRPQSNDPNFTHRPQSNDPNFTHRPQSNDPNFTHRPQSNDPNFTHRPQSNDPNFTHRPQSNDPNFTHRPQSNDPNFTHRPQSNDPNFTHRPQSNDPNFTHRPQSNDPNFTHRPQSNDPNFTHRPQSNDPNFTHRPQSNDPNFTHRPQSNDPNFTHRPQNQPSSVNEDRRQQFPCLAQSQNSGQTMNTSSDSPLAIGPKIISTLMSQSPVKASFQSSPAGAKADQGALDSNGHPVIGERVKVHKSEGFVVPTLGQGPREPPYQVIDSTIISVETDDNKEVFEDPAVGGVAIALCHGAVLFEVAKRELHATTALKEPNRYQPKRISLVFYQHKNLNLSKHGYDEYERKAEERKSQAEQARLIEEMESNGFFKGELTELASFPNLTKGTFGKVFNFPETKKTLFPLRFPRYLDSSPLDQVTPVMFACMSIAFPKYMKEAFPRPSCVPRLMNGRTPVKMSSTLSDQRKPEHPVDEESLKFLVEKLEECGGSYKEISSAWNPNMPLCASITTNSVITRWVHEDTSVTGPYNKWVELSEDKSTEELEEDASEADLKAKMFESLSELDEQVFLRNLNPGVLEPEVEDVPNVFKFAGNLTPLKVIEHEPYPCHDLASVVVSLDHSQDQLPKDFDQSLNYLMKSASDRANGGKVQKEMVPGSPRRDVTGTVELSRVDLSKSVPTTYAQLATNTSSPASSVTTSSDTQLSISHDGNTKDQPTHGLEPDHVPSSDPPTASLADNQKASQNLMESRQRQSIYDFLMNGLTQPYLTSSQYQTYQSSIPADGNSPIGVNKPVQ
ncbi:uncharacterized protein LOC131952728 [Physella acuta]|uniref:uncharacterized protein LOC131952728 n=1 Tax=Physella acuta TaxID=109671 RepID=UPI0027DACFBD|nr:uncharacterized protein LOC131952728 [Physella acuta]XP_059171642.1 uncharacterized protein LOC131952728 [Physella acuta]